MKKNNFTKTYEWLKQYENTGISICHMSDSLSIELYFDKYTVSIDQYTTVEITDGKQVYRIIANNSEDNDIQFTTDKTEMEPADQDAQIETDKAMVYIWIKKENEINNEVDKANSLLKSFYTQVNQEYERVKRNFTNECTADPNSDKVALLQDAMLIYYDMIHYLIRNSR